MKPVLLTALALLAVSAAQAAEDTLARKLASAMISDLIARQPAAAERLQGVVIALQNGRISVEQAESLLRIAQLTGTIAGPQAPVASASAPGPASEPAPVNPLSGSQPESVLAVLDSEAPVAPEPDTEAPTDPTSTTEPSADPDLVAAVAPVCMVSEQNGQTIVMLAGGSALGLAKDQRLRIERDGKTQVLIVLYNVREELSAGFVLESTWAPGAAKPIQAGDLAVLDKTAAVKTEAAAP